MTTKLFCLTVNTELKWFLKRHKKIEKYIFQLAYLIPGSVKKTLGSDSRFSAGTGLKEYLSKTRMPSH